MLVAIQLETPLFEPVAFQERGAVVPAGGRPVTMPLPFGAARCEAVGSARGPAILVAHLEGEEVRIPLSEHPAGALE
ncbi:MAG: hypothetical protein KY463_16435, partial [Actinobacteria bacterium]|nr:hypothetical protein [Actinomycetota bacterium]